MGSSLVLIEFTLLLLTVVVVPTVNNMDKRCSSPTEYTNLEGEIRSHTKYGSEDYPPNLRCIYEIRVPKGYEIHIKLLDIDIEETNECLFDFLAIADYKSDNPYYLCGQHPPLFPIVIQDSVAQITFVSDTGNHGRGFKIKYHAKRKQTIDRHGCGRTRSPELRRRKRIIGGTAVLPGQWPWIVSIWDEQKFRCGASLIDPEWLLTAAHCFSKNVTTKNWHVVLGDYLLDFDDTEEVVAGLAEVHLHPNYEEHGHYDNDFALVKLDTKIKYSRSIQPICLPDEDADIHDLLDRQGSKCYVAGWGRSETQSNSNELRHLRLQMIDTEKCNGSTIYDGKLTSSMFCAGYIEGGKDACKGDSGGPLMCENMSDKRWYQVGVISFGKGCADKNQPGIYSNVYKEMDWINTISKRSKFLNQMAT